MTEAPRRAGTQRNLERAMALLDEVPARPDGFPGAAVVLPFSDDLPRTLSASRIRLLRLLPEDGPADSVGRLAAALGRDLGAVSRDVAFLEGVGLVERRRAGKQKRVAATRRLILVR